MAPRFQSQVSRQISGIDVIRLIYFVSDTMAPIEIRLECRCLQKCFIIWNYGPTLGFDTKQKIIFLIKFGVFLQ